MGTSKKDFLVDITNVEVKLHLPKNERIKKFIEDIKNPYYFKVGEIIVKASFKEGATTLEEKMQRYFDSL